MDLSAFHSPIDRAAAVCYRREGKCLQFMLVRTDAGRWTFPKGRIEKGETPWLAAQREALEEAGVRGRVTPELLMTFPHEKRAADGRRMGLTVAAYLLQVDSDCDPAEPGRNPTWCGPEEAKQRLGLKRDAAYQQAYASVIDRACAELRCQG